MIKHLLKNIPNFVSEELKSDEAILISASDLMDGTKDFLNKNFKGCFDNETITTVKKTIYVSLKKYSIFLNLVFKVVLRWFRLSGTACRNVSFFYWSVIGD